jgi:N-acetylglucosaminyl-diphospho-decaprenol L-rhamnosyltransferase
MVEVSMVIVNFHTEAMIATLLDRLECQGDLSGVELILIDNGGDGSLNELKSRGAVSQIITMGRNAGFAAACNAAVRASSAPYVLLLNPDTKPHAGFVRELLVHAKSDARKGVVGGQTRRRDGSIDPGNCWGAPSLWSMACFASGLSWAFPAHPIANPEALLRYDRRSPGEVDIVTGCLFLVSRDLWESLGGLDEEYFMYSEDADFCAKVWAAGYTCSITPSVVIEHEWGGASSSEARRAIMTLAGRATYLRKRWRPGQARLGLLLLRAGVLLRLAATTCGRSTSAAHWREVWRHRAVWRGGWQGRGDLWI